MHLQAIFVLGGGSQDNGIPHPWVIRRLEKAIEIWQSNKSALIIPLAGGTYHKPTPLDELNFPIWEACSCAEWLVDNGIPENKIWREWSSHDTIGGSLFGHLHQIIPLKMEYVALITSKFHMERSKFIWEWIGSCLKCTHTTNYITVDDYGMEQEVLNGRTVKEQQNLRTLEKNIKGIESTEQLLKWFFTEHDAYRALMGRVRREKFKSAENRVTNDTLKSY